MANWRVGLVVERLAWVVAGVSVCVLGACGEPPQEDGGRDAAGPSDAGDVGDVGDVMGPDADADGQVSFANLPATVDRMRGEEGSFEVEASSTDGSTPQLEVAANGCPFDVEIDTSGAVSWTCGTEQPAECDVTLGASGASAQGTLSLVCTNRVPQVSSVAATPAEPTIISELRCDYDFSDGDSDPDLSRVAWFRDGDPAGTGLRYTGARAPGDVITCRVTPDDGWDEGTAVDSAEVTIGDVSARSLGDFVQGSPKLLDATHAIHLDNAVYFLAKHESLGRELWRLDLATQTTSLVRDVMDGPGDGAINRPMQVIGSTLYFAANDGVHGEELWSSDGTTQGTVRVADVIPGVESGRARHLAVFDQTLYFITEQSGGHSSALWRINPDTGQPENVEPYIGGDPKLDEGAEFAGELYFTCDTGDSDLCRLSPSSGVTVLSTTASGSDVGNIVATTQAVYFTKGRTLWRTDGTQAGTERWGGFNDVVDLFAYQNDLYVSEVTSSGASNRHAVHRYQDDGSGQTTLVGEYSTDYTDLYAQFLGHVPAGVVYMAPHPDNHTHALWATDGTPTGTQQFTDDIFVDSVARDGDVFFFSARPSSSNFNELWRTDGTAAGTERVGTSTFGRNANVPELSAAAGVVLIDPRFLDNPSEVLFEGANAPSALRADDLEHGSFPLEAAELGQGAVISMRNGSGGYSLMHFDVAEDTVAEIDHQLLGQALALGEPAVSLTSVGDRVYFEAGTSDARRLWWTDGTGEGTAYLARTAGGNLPGEPTGMTALDGKVVFSGYDAGIANEPWVSDGTEQGSMLLANIDEMVNGGSSPGHFTRVGDKIYFLANSSSYERALWVTDGTPDGTRMLSSSMDFQSLQEGGGTLYFGAETDSGSRRLGRYDAETGQTELLAQLPEDHEPGKWVAAADTIFVIGSRGEELVWRLDDGAFTQIDGEPYSSYRNNWIVGTKEAAFWLREDRGMWSIRAAAADSSQATVIADQLHTRPAWMYPLDGRVIFEALDGGVSRLFISDGTSEGTGPLLDGASGLKNVQPLARTPAGLLVSAYTDDQGQELWLIE